ncbi:type VI secretion system baseplate subunit TssK [Shewanella psychropiezotolerans]|uniref:Type VI secretion system baseplate subunit TssK n=1 Tax=Shewanella psychropiezotolerans TaxID=2593655 RepID=A0ABX5WWE3_9GAMM|nr:MULTISPECIES: type VI secretion system baseplate subunit TssK [Shewanella]MPY26913.1 type VI secretion system baseplate subunit TssK [Shewanella sp. YLB-07]QDO83359.1 type VI secretion system baseplate subunit TssK [Shewanella psychropiezotolerans]
MDCNKVLWNEGMFLSPQHFQQQERYVEHFIRQFVGQHVSQCYGLSSLKLDCSMLNIGKLIVRHAKGIFPDGSPFEIEHRLELDIAKDTSKKKIYLALPVSHPGIVNVGEDKNQRHSSVKQNVFDTSREHSDALELELAHLNIELKIEGEELKNYTLLAVAEISEYTAEGKLTLNQAFIPPCIQFNVSGYLKDCVADVFAHVQYRARTTSSRLHSDNSSKSYQGLMRDYLWLQALGSWMPKLEQWNEVGGLSTQQLYFECVSMAGQMQGLEGKVPSSFPIWDLNDLYRCFSQVFSELMLLLREVQVDNVSTLHWQTQLFATRRLLQAQVTDRSLYHQGRFIMVVTSPIGSARLGKEFPEACKLAGNSDIVGLVRNALSGVTLRHLPYAPSELKARHDAAYFEVDDKSALWQALIKKEEPIALHIDERIDDIDVELHVIK